MMRVQLFFGGSISYFKPSPNCPGRRVGGNSQKEVASRAFSSVTSSVFLTNHLAHQVCCAFRDKVCKVNANHRHEKKKKNYQRKTDRVTFLIRASRSLACEPWCVYIPSDGTSADAVLYIISRRAPESLAGLYLSLQR